MPAFIAGNPIPKRKSSVTIPYCNEGGSVTEDKAIYIRLALIVVSLLVLGDAGHPVYKEPAHFDNVVIEAPKELEQSELLQPQQEVSQIPVAQTVSATTPTPPGSHQDWMQAAGIQSGDYAYVEYIISHESGWRPDAINASSGACGLVQALPCSKLGNDWSNPVKALSWGAEYAKARYGGWANAYAFWQANRWW